MINMNTGLAKKTKSSAVVFKEIIIGAWPMAGQTYPRYVVAVSDFTIRCDFLWGRRAIHRKP